VIVINDKLIVGSSFDEHNAKVDAILNVAKDLLPTRDWGAGIEYVHIGLVDGPGNLPEYYYAAVMALFGLLKNDRKVLVCCHDGFGRSMAVVVMYLNATNGMGWDTLLSMIQEGCEDGIPKPRAEHKKAFENMNWRLLAKVVNDGE
jgi:hypothetical protein